MACHFDEERGELKISGAKSLYLGTDFSFYVVEMTAGIYCLPLNLLNQKMREESKIDFSLISK